MSLESKILIGHTTRLQRHSGGAWLIGDQLPQEHPGRTDRVSYKSWVAYPIKYAPGKYPLRCRTEQGHWEYVQVFRGVLDCIVVRDDITCRGSFNRFAAIDLPPEIARRWELPPTQRMASGITLLRRSGSLTGADAFESGYQFHVWTARSLPLVVAALSSIEWRVCFIEVLAGTVQLSLNKTFGRISCFTLSVGQHVFLPGNDRLTIGSASCFAAGTCIYFL